MKFRSLIAGCSVGLAATALCAGGVAAAPVDVISLDSHSANNSLGGNSAAGTVALDNGVSYELRVTGTFSAWKRWPARRCGKPDPAAVFPSSSLNDIFDGPTSDDAVFRFAQPLYKGACPKTFPKATGIFQVDLGAGWKTFVPDGGVPAKPTGNRHPYSKVVTGTGVTPKFRIADHHASDNYGKLRIAVTQESLAPPT